MTFTELDQLPLTLNANHVATALGISRSQAYNLLHAKSFPTIRVGRRRLVPKTRFIRWMDEQTGGAA